MSIDTCRDVDVTLEEFDFFYSQGVGYQRMCARLGYPTYVKHRHSRKGVDARDAELQSSLDTLLCRHGRAALISALKRRDSGVPAELPHSDALLREKDR